MKTSRQESTPTHFYRDVPIGLCHLDAEFRIIEINRWLADLQGRSPTDLMGRHLGDVFPQIADQMERSI